MMNQVNQNELYQRLKTQAYNSSHYVWLWSDLKFLESSNGWIFGMTKELGVNLVALEPLPPLNSHGDDKSLNKALIELQEHFKDGPIAFVGINAPFAKNLSGFGYANFQIGKEPWVDLSDIKPTGHAGRKVRVGRNQALKSGLRVEEWKLIEVIKDEKKLAALNEVKELWEALSFVNLSGFLHGMSFDSIPEDRRCFIALTQENIVDGILIVTPIQANKSWYFEDMLIRTNSEATKGIGELLVLSAMEALQQDGFKEISLGVVPMTTVGTSDFGEAPPPNFLKLTNAFQSFMGIFYNASGMELFRKRFKVARWDKIYLSVLTDKKRNRSETFQWIKVLLSITAAYKPSFQLKPSFLIEKAVSPLLRFPTSFSFVILSIASFLITLKIPSLANFILGQLEFSENAPLWQWPLRTLTSQLIYFDSTQFGVLFVALATIIFYIEKEVYEKKWATYLLVFFILNEIVIKIIFSLLAQNIQVLNITPSMVHLFPTHGGGILLASFLGFSTIFRGPKKDEFFAFGILAFIALSFISPLFDMPAMSFLYGSTFFVEGYLVGKFYLNFQSQKDALVAKNKKEEIDVEVTSIQSNSKQNIPDNLIRTAV